MALIDELHELYKEAQKNKNKRNNVLAEEAYNKVISQVKKDVLDGRNYSSFSFHIFNYDEEVKNILCDKLKQDGFSIDFGMYDEYFEISGWANEPSPWEKAFMEYKYE